MVLTLRWERERLGIPQRELAEVLGIARATLTRVETGIVPLTYLHILTYCDLLNCNLSYVEERSKSMKALLKEIGIIVTTEVKVEKLPTSQVITTLNQYSRTLRKV